MAVDDYLRLLKAQRRILDLRGEAVYTAGIVQSPVGRDHLRHGLGRRLGFLLTSIGVICEALPPERTDPITHDEAEDLNLHLNSIYVHIRGATDNLGWVLAMEHHVLGPPREDDQAFRRRVALLSPAFRDALTRTLPDLAGDISSHCDLLSELPQLRDPVAHRIPLYLVPAVLSEDEARRYRELDVEFNEALSRLDFAVADQKFDAMSSLGTFQPVFAHSLIEPVESFPLHTRLATDLTALSEILSASLNVLRTIGPRGQRDSSPPTTL